MPFTLLDAEDADFEDLAYVTVLANEWPVLQPMKFLFHPPLGEDPDARAAAIRAMGERDRRIRHADPTIVWKKVIVTDGDYQGGGGGGRQIVAGSMWRIFETNPYEKSLPTFEATWYPEGGARDYVNDIVGGNRNIRPQYMSRPFILLQSIFVHPDYRGRGLARLMLDWGAQKADELDLPTWLDCLDGPKPLYQKCGFTVVSERLLQSVPKTDPPSKEWTMMEQLIGSMKVNHMWRPAGGSYIEGVTVKPWEG